MLRIGGIVVNPKTGEPFFCTVEEPDDPNKKTEYFSIRRMNGSREGGGYFELDNESGYYASARATNFPSVHTPEGVKTKGSGNGTCLYVCGAAVVAVVQWRDANRMHGLTGWRVVTGVPFSRRKVGISSTEDRSSAASAWWSKAVELGLASEESVDKTEEREVSDCRFGEPADNVATDVFYLDVSYGSSLEVCITGTLIEGSTVEANTLEYNTAFDNNLVVGICPQEPMDWETRDEHEWSDTVDVPRRRWAQFNKQAARAVNVGVFREYEDPESTFALWMKICVLNGMEESEIAEMTERFNEGFDVQPSAIMGYEDPRPRRNPSRPTARTKADPFAAIIKSYAPPKTRKNPSQGKGVQRSARNVAAAQRLLEERVRLGWNKFASLP